MAKAKHPQTEPPARWMTARIDGSLDAALDAEVIRRLLPPARLPMVHPVRKMWTSVDPNHRIALHHLADDLRLVEGTPGFEGLVKRLRTDVSAYDDMRYELRLTATLKRGGQSLISLGGSQAGPDVEFVSQSGHTCAVACYRLRSATNTIQLLRAACKLLGDHFFRLFFFHPMPGDWLLDITFAQVPLRAGDTKVAEDLLCEAWKRRGPGSYEQQGISVSKASLPALHPLPGQKRRCQVRFFFPVRQAELQRVSGQLWDKVQKERAWASKYDGVPVLAIEESHSVLGGALKEEIGSTLRMPNNPFAGVLLTSAQTMEDVEWLPGPTVPETLALHLTTFGPSVRTWAHGYHLVTHAPEHAIEEWSFFETVAGAGSEIVRSLTYGVHCQRIESPLAGVDPKEDASFQARVQSALDRFRAEMAKPAESKGVVPVLGGT